MMTTLRSLGLLLVAALVARQDAAPYEKLLKDAKLGLLEAIEKAQKEGASVVIHAELEGAKTTVYSVDVAKNDAMVNVVIDAADGSIVEKQDESEDHSAEVKACRVSLADAVKSAVKKNPGSPVEAEILLRAGKAVVEVKVVAGGKLVTVQVDGATGAIIEGQGEKVSFTDTYFVEEGELGPTGENPYFWALTPGLKLTLEGKDGGEDAHLLVTVLDETKKIAGVETRIIEERETVGGKLIEVSRNYFAISKRTNCVYYFGEDVDMYRDGKVVGHDGSWIAGEKGAKFGMMMPGTPLLGARYYQEIAPGVAMDRAEITGLNETLETPFGKLEKCVRTEETTPLEKDRGIKTYARGIGLVQDSVLKLTKVERPGK